MLNLAKFVHDLLTCTMLLILMSVVGHNKLVACMLSVRVGLCVDYDDGVLLVND